MCELLVGGNMGLTAIEKTIIDRSVKLTYANYFTKKNVPIPTLKDFYTIVKSQPEPEAANIAIRNNFV